MSEDKNISNESAKPVEKEEEQATGNKQLATLESQTSNFKPETTNMETHAHHLHKAPGKNFWHYLFEFLMLFLAVFAGFLAENFREHSIENKRAKQFAVSLLSDIKADTAALQVAIGYGNKKIKGVDSLTALLEQPKEKWKDTLIYTYTGITGRTRPFKHNSGTYEQMKASGSLRYFKQELTDLLNQYDVQAKKTEVREEIHQNYASNLLNPFLLNVLDIRSVIQTQDGAVPTHPLVFRKKDSETVALWINYATVVQSTQQRTVVEYDIMLTKANQIILALEKEYHLE